jgi:hypothetical protein
MPVKQSPMKPALNARISALNAQHVANLPQILRFKAKNKRKIHHNLGLNPHFHRFEAQKDSPKPWAIIKPGPHQIWYDPKRASNKAQI